MNTFDPLVSKRCYKDPIPVGEGLKIMEEEFLNSLPYTYHEENILHAFIISSIKDYDLFIKAIENHQFDSVTHNKAIQKALESYLVNEEHKNYLKTLKIKEK